MLDALREPRREACTIPTATAPEAVFTVRASALTRFRALLMRKSPGLRLQTCRPQPCARVKLDPVIKAGYDTTEPRTPVVTR